MDPHVFRHHPLLGTVVEVRIADDAASAAAADRAIVDEIRRLEAVFSAFDPASELSRWKRGELDDPSDDFAPVLVAALDWHHRSGGRFNPLTGLLTRAWRSAESAGAPPPDDHLAELAASIAEPRYDLVDGWPVPTGDCTHLDLNAFAKGWIVDAAIAAGLACGVGEVTVNAGGDLAHHGSVAITVGIEHPLRPYDNEPPIARVELGNGGLATSGSARQGFRVGGCRWSHVIDPRTGRPVDAQASISVVGPDAATADVAATILGVLDPAVAVEEAPALGVACLVIAPDGVAIASDGWSGTVPDGPVVTRRR